MSYKSIITTLENSLKENIKAHLSVRNIAELKFKRAFVVTLENYDYEGVMAIPATVTALLHDGTVVTKDEELLIGELDIYELAHIMDTLESTEYTVVSEMSEIDH